MSKSHRSTLAGRQSSGLPPVRVPVPALRAPGPRFVLPMFAGGRRPRPLAALTWLALACALVALALTVVGPRLGLYRVNVVLSGSMHPHWEAGDLVVTVPRDPATLQVGDVLTYHPPTTGSPSVTHRIVELREPGPTPVVVTKGDANESVDPWGPVRLKPGTVWVVERSVPNLGWAMAAMQQRWIALVTTIVAPLALMVLLLVHIWRPKRVAP